MTPRTSRPSMRPRRRRRRRTEGSGERRCSCRIRSADQRHRLAAREFEVEGVQHVATAVVCEANAAERHRAGSGRELRQRLVLDDLAAPRPSPPAPAPPRPTRGATCATMYDVIRSGNTSCSRSALNTTRSPMVSEPPITSSPPTYSTVTSASIGSRSSNGLKFERSRPSLIASRCTASAPPTSRSISTCSAPRPLTTRTPATPSSTPSTPGRGDPGDGSPPA